MPALRISVMAGGETVAQAEWPFADVIRSHTDPMNCSAAVTVRDARFATIESIAGV